MDGGQHFSQKRGRLHRNFDSLESVELVFRHDVVDAFQLGDGKIVFQSQGGQGITRLDLDKTKVNLKLKELFRILVILLLFRRIGREEERWVLR